MVLIGLIGNKYSGKSTTANYLKQQYNFEEHAFATHLKNIIKTAFHIDDEYLYGNKKEDIIHEYNKTARQIMQITGDMYKTNFGSDFFVNQIEYILQNSDNMNIVISDIRFLNEYNLIKKYGGYMIRINRDSNINSDTHSSETENKILIADYTINNTTLKELYDQINEIMFNIKNQ